MDKARLYIREDRLRLLLDHVYTSDIKTVLEALLNHATGGSEPERDGMSSEAFILYTVMAHDIDDAKVDGEV